MSPRASLAAAALAVLGLTACGSTTADSAAPPRPTTPASTVATDSSGRVACSTGELPGRGEPVRFATHLGETSATLTARVGRGEYLPWLADPVVTVTAAGTSWRDRLRPAPGAFDHRYVPTPVALDRAVSGYLCLVRFDPGRPATAVVSVYAGGAHCCTTFRLADLAARQETQVDTGNVGGRLRIVDGQVLLATGDDAFNYAFADFADSCAPVRLLQPRAGGVADVTTAHPETLRADARRWWRMFLARRVGLGYLACWAADQERLGRDRLVRTTLAEMRRENRLRQPFQGPPQGAAYIRALRAFLAEHGYLAGQAAAPAAS